MKSIITEEIRFREWAVNYGIKHGNNEKKPGIPISLNNSYNVGESKMMAR